MAMPLNLVDTKSGMDYFTAAQRVINDAWTAVEAKLAEG